MAIKKTSDCVGCDECRNCGANKPRLAVFCDDCHREIDAIVYIVGGKRSHICDDCLPSAVPCVDVDTLLKCSGEFA